MIANALPPLAESLSFEDRVEIEDVLDAAAAWKRGEIPWTAAAGLGRMLDWRGQPNEAYTRYVAYRVTPRSDPRLADLDELIEVIIRAQGFVITRQGVFTPTEIRAHDSGFDASQVHARSWH
jgi:hypothetical protein